MMTRYQLDSSVERFGDILLGGSPLRLFRTTAAGTRTVDAIERGDEIATSQLVDRLLDAGAIHPVAVEATRFTVADVTVVTPTLGPPVHPTPGALLVDDGSPDPVTGAAIRLSERSGPAAARNAGLAAVTTPLVAFVDADVVASPGWLDPLLAHFDDDRVGLVAPRVRSTPGATRLANYESRHSPLDLGPTPAPVVAGGRVSYVPAAAIVCRADAVRAVGGFDESLRFGEDVDLVWRLAATGWRCRYEPTSVVRHDPRRDWAAWFRQRAAYGSSAAPLSQRHPGALAPLRASAWSVAAWALASARHPLAGAAVAAATSGALVAKLPDVPGSTAFRLAASGTVRAGGQIAQAVRRAWWPLLGIAALRSGTARRALLASAIAARSPIRLADDVAYSIGVWRGMAAEGSVAPITPDLRGWPGRSGARRLARYRATA